LARLYRDAQETRRSLRHVVNHKRAPQIGSEQSGGLDLKPAAISMAEGQIVRLRANRQRLRSGRRAEHRRQCD
jgi:hypothetical protein